MMPTAETVDALFAEMTDLLALPDKEWRLMGTENDCTVHTMKYKNFPLKLCKLTAIVKYPVDIVKFELCDIEHRSEWDNMVKSARIVQRVDGITIIHLEAPSLAIFSARDIVFYEILRPLVNDSGFMTITKSVPNSEKHVVPKKDVIRLEVIIGGGTMEVIEIDGKPATKLTTISMADPKGMIPKINFKPVFMKTTESIKALREHLKKKYPAPR